MRGLPRATSSGFTLIEILVVTAIFSMLITLGLFMSMETFRGVGYRSEQDTIVSLLQKARSRAMNNINQAPWGVCSRGGLYIVFKGLVCITTGDTISASLNATTTGLTGNGIVFTQLSGTTTPATVTLTQNGKISTTTINYEGTIIW